MSRKEFIKRQMVRRMKGWMSRSIKKFLLVFIIVSATIIGSWLYFWYCTELDVLHYIVGWLPMIVLASFPVVTFALESCKKDLEKTRESCLRFKRVLNN